MIIDWQSSRFGAPVVLHAGGTNTWQFSFVLGAGDLTPVYIFVSAWSGMSGIDRVNA